MQAVGDYLIVRIPEAKKKTEGGIELPDDSKQPFHYGRVESVGFRVGNEPDEALPGNYAVFDPQGAVPIQLDPLGGESKIMVLHKEQVFAIVTKAELEQMGLPT